MNIDRVTDLVMQLAVLPFFPAEPAARLAIVRMICEMADNEEQVRWLIRVMTSGLYRRWEGLAELRWVFVQKFRPRDGIDPTGISEVYPDGLTREQLNPGVDRAALSGSSQQQIAGDVGKPRRDEPVRDDPKLAELVNKVATARVAPQPRVRVDTTVRPGESEPAALMRSIEDYRERAVEPRIRPASEEALAFIKAEQNRCRKESREFVEDLQTIAEKT
jgi:hypothetical protein